jgi:hypothetical protein
MSLKNHPNFHAINFTTQILSAYYESLRGAASTKNAPDISDAVIKFVSIIEDKVDITVGPADPISAKPHFDFADDSIGDIDDDLGKSSYEENRNKDQFLCIITWPDGTEGLLFPRPGNVPIADTQELGESDFETACQHLKEYYIPNPPTPLWEEYRDNQPKLGAIKITLKQFKHKADIKEFLL